MNDIISHIPAPVDDQPVQTLKVIRGLRQSLAPHYGDREAEAMIRMIFAHLKGWSPVDLIINENKPLSPFIVGQVHEIARRLMNDEPIQYIVGTAYFYGMDFLVGPGVLVPRPETEELVDLVVNANKRPDLRVLDACSGSGCIAIALSRNLPFSQVTALEKSEQAADYLRRNAEALHARIEVVEDDIFNYEPAAGSLDIIVSNPPYIDTSERGGMDRNVLDYEPSEALFVPDDNPLLFYRRIAAIGCRALAPGGRIYFEINPRHADGMRALMEGLGYDDIDIVLDIHGKKRFLSACWQNKVNE